jgi:hypothetical protein
MGVADGWCLQFFMGDVGYAIAAFNPMRQWPIVLIGLMGKVLGPLGFAKALYDGSFPPMVGFTILTNGLIWWVPFGIILVAALRQMGTRNYQRVEVLPLNKALCSYRFANGDSISETSRKQTVLLCFLRHFG